MSADFDVPVSADVEASSGLDSPAHPAKTPAHRRKKKRNKKAKKRRKGQAKSERASGRLRLPAAIDELLFPGRSKKKKKGGKGSPSEAASPSGGNRDWNGSIGSAAPTDFADGPQAKNAKAKKKKKGTRTAKQRRRFINEILYLLLKIGLAIVALAAILMLVVGAYRVSDNYMEPMVKSGDLIFFNRLDKTASAGEVIIVKYEGHETASRVIAKAGDTVDIKGGSVLVNGNHQFEDSIYYDTEQISGGATFPLTVPEGKLFVLGDQRKKAVDSRMFGCVSTSEIEGKLALVVRRREF